MGHAWRECLRRPGSWLLALGMRATVLLMPHLLKAEVVEAIFTDRTTGLFVGVSFGSLLAVGGGARHGLGRQGAVWVLMVA
ncbi:hypothetical protein [Streptomyces luteolus]|uniref:Uncharacterized protein n=1 Tax=Streptomyces luteolus TaxID=3043615 RepID=A0ABT6SRD6_9ACTN|nr:hypothetical protein [Streptomyces sp. B-S-A12]MDI3417805.1 hypothetical protein [Streptomyces sp. B-S-A12]